MLEYHYNPEPQSPAPILPALPGMEEEVREAMRQEFNRVRNQTHYNSEDQPHPLSHPDSIRYA